MIIPYVLEKTSEGERVFDLYSKLLTNRIIFIEGEITDKLSNIVIAELLYLDSINNDDISVIINSPGGSISAGMAIYDTMKYIKSDVSTIGIGICASMAAILLSSGTVGKRCVLKNTDIMIHQPIGGAEGQATEIGIVAKRITNLKDRLNRVLAKNTGKSFKKIERDTDRDYYMNSREALEYNIIDKII